MHVNCCIRSGGFCGPGIFPACVRTEAVAVPVLTSVSLSSCRVSWQSRGPPSPQALRSPWRAAPLTPRSWRASWHLASATQEQWRERRTWTAVGVRGTACAGEDRCIVALAPQQTSAQPSGFSRVRVAASQGRAGPGCVGPGADNRRGWTPRIVLRKEETRVPAGRGGAAGRIGLEGLLRPLPDGCPHPIPASALLHPRK